MNRRTAFKYGLKKYSALAASLVLAVIIGANGKSMMDMMNDDSGVISENTSTESVNDSGEISETESTENDGNEISADTIGKDMLPPPLQEHRLKAEISQNKGDIESQGNTLSSNVYTAEAAENEQISTEAQYSDGETEESGYTAQATETPKAVSTPSIPKTPPTPETVAEYSVEEETASDEGYVISGSGMTDTYAYVDENQSAASARNSSSDISGEESTENYYIPIDGIVTIKSSDYDQAITIIAKYVRRVYNDCYIITGTQYQNMIDELYSKDVDFDSSVMQNSDSISFKIIVTN